MDIASRCSRGVKPLPPRAEQSCHAEHMKTKLPPLLAAFVAAKNAHDTKAFIACFSPDAIVSDEKQTHKGDQTGSGFIVCGFPNPPSRAQALGSIFMTRTSRMA